MTNLFHSFSINKVQILLSFIFVLLMTSLAVLILNKDFAEAPFKALKYEYFTKDVHIILGVIASFVAFVGFCILFRDLSKIQTDRFDFGKRIVAYFISFMLLWYVSLVILSNMYIDYAYSMTP